jgi:hypothetical protein
VRLSDVDVAQYRVLFLTVTFVVALLAASPVLSRVLVYPRTEFFTELWLLGPEHTAEGYPYNVSSGTEYSVYLGVSNRLGYTAYYQVQVKFRNASEPGPTSFGPEGTRVPSNVSSLLNLTVFVGDLQTWERQLPFSFTYAYNPVTGRVDFGSLTFWGIPLDLTGRSIAWNASRREFAGILFFETWLYQNETVEFTYHERFVSLRLNMTG